MAVSRTASRTASSPHAAAPLVDVLLPVRGARRTLPSALGDILAERELPLRVLAIVDTPPDGDDGSRDWLAAAARADRRLIVLPGPGAGLTAALDAGLAAVTAPCVAHMEADDRSLPGRLPRLHAALTADPSLDAVVCRAAQFGARTPGMRRYLDWQNALLSHEQLGRERFVEIPALHQTGLYRSSALRALGGYATAGAWPADIDFWLRWFAAADAGPRFRVARLPVVLYRWRQHGGQSTRGGSHALAVLRAAKAHHLARFLHGRPVVLLSVGNTRTAWERELRARGVDVQHSLEWRPRAPVPGVVASVLSAEARVGAPLVVAAYGRREARERVRAALGDPQEPERLLFTA